jgi:polysaccharide biosynthesis protein PslG
VGTHRRHHSLPVPVLALIVGLAVAALSLGGCGSDTPPPSRGPWIGTGFFGVNAPLLRQYATPAAAPALDAIASSIAAAHVSWARVVFDQSVEERTPGHIDWSIPDRVVGTLARHGVRTQALFVGTPGWAASTSARLIFGCGSRAAPEDVDGVSRFVGEAVKRYGRGGQFWAANPGITPLPVETWEIGNEENLRIFWCPSADPAKYASVYSASRSAALDADPDAQVIVGGLAPTFEATGQGDVSVQDFLRGMVRADPELAREISAVAIHPYASTPAFVFFRIRQFREAMRAAGLGSTPMLADEFGWYTSGPPSSRLAPQALRAGRIRQVVLAAQRTDCGLVGLGVNSWVTTQADPTNPEDWYGLADPVTGVPNASGRAYGAAIAAAGAIPGTPAAGKLAHLCG